MSQTNTIVILGTGGTIAGRSADPSDNVGYSAAELGIAELIAAIPALAEKAPLVTEQVAQLDSKDMAFAVWADLARRVNHHLAQPEVAGLVITHGTDTLEETAYFLQAVCRPLKPVVFACAMRPASSLLADGPQNLLDALAVARYAGASGVTVVCAGIVHSALDVQKVHPYQLNAFSSGDAGPLAHVEEGRVRLLRDWPCLPGIAGPVPGEWTAPRVWPWVEIVMNYAGADGRVVEALVERGVQGLVVAGTGNGSLHHALEAALLKAQSAGVRVLRSTRCPNGRVLPKEGDVLAGSNGLSPVKARVALLLELIAGT